MNQVGRLKECAGLVSIEVYPTGQQDEPGRITLCLDHLVQVSESPRGAFLEVGVTLVELVHRDDAPSLSALWFGWRLARRARRR